MSAFEVQAFLRDTMTEFGKPINLRVDNGYPWGSNGDFPTDWSLWVIGLGIKMIWNPPRQPQKNGVVERAQGTGKRWSEPGKCSSVEELQQTIDRMDRIQRDQYPYQCGLSRMETFPELSTNSRRYDCELEVAEWSWDLVGEHLTRYSVPRRVDRGGSISIYNRNYYIGTRYAQQDVWIELDPLTREWIFRDANGQQLRSQPADVLTSERIRGLEVANRRKTKTTKSLA